MKKPSPNTALQRTAFCGSSLRFMIDLPPYSQPRSVSRPPLSFIR